MKSKYLLGILSVIILSATACSMGENPNSLKEDNKTQIEERVIEDSNSIKNDESTTYDKEDNILASNNPTQERIDFLQDRALYYYWHGGDLKENEKAFFQGVTLKGDQDVIEAIYEEIIALDPLNTEYQRSLASTKLLNNKLPEAVSIFKNVSDKEPDNFDALMQAYTFDGILNDKFDENLKLRLQELNQEKADTFFEYFDLLEKIREEKVNTQIKKYEDGHTFVLLGYALDEEGKMQDTLEKRLELMLKILEENPTSKVVVAGGVPKNNNTESKVMKNRLMEKGIDEDRIIKEDLSTDTVENALFSINKIGELDYRGDITVVSSASHIRRALTLFNVADKIMGNAIYPQQYSHTIDAIGEPDGDELIEASSDKERLVMYRDLLRILGIWQYPGIQR